MMYAMRSGSRKRGRNTMRIDLRHALVVGCWTTLVLVLLDPGTSAQQSIAGQPRFEVAAIVPHADTSDMQAGIEVTESFVRIRNLSLRAVIGIAYDVRDSRLVGPAQLDGRRFDITAKPPAGWTREQLPTLLRALLAERFKLVVHQEAKQVPGYALRAQPRGHRMRPSDGPRTYLTARPGLIVGNGRSVSELAPLLGQMVGTPVVDETGLKGTYDIKLVWTDQLSAVNAIVVAEPEISIFTALQEQLGLRLEPVKISTEVVVVDSVEGMPTPN